MLAVDLPARSNKRAFKGAAAIFVPDCDEVTRREEILTKRVSEADWAIDRGPGR